MINSDLIHIWGLFIKDTVEPERLQDFVQKANLDQFYECYTKKDWESLRPFSVLLDGKVKPLLHFDNGKAILPTDYFGNPTMLTEAGERVNIVDDDKDFDELKSHKIEYPTAKYPIANIQSNFIRLEPDTIRYCRFSYIAKPNQVKFGYKNTRGFVEYDPVSSVSLAWNDNNVIQIIIRVLQSFGIIKTEEEVKNKINTNN